MSGIRKFTVQLSEAELDRINKLVARTDGGSKTAVFRSAIRLFEWLMDKDEEGYEFILRKKNKEQVVKLFV